MSKQTALVKWSPAIGIGVAILFSFLPTGTYWLWTLVVLGVALGALRSQPDSIHAFLTGTIVIVISAYFGQNIVNSSDTLSLLFDALIAIFAPAIIAAGVRYSMVGSD